MNKCRICGAKSKKFLHLGRSHPPEEFRKKKELKNPVATFELGLSQCLNCGQVQLSSEIPTDTMYKDNYYYDYSLTKTGMKHWNELAKIIYKKHKLTKDDLVVDIGSNTGKLLEIFKELGVRIMGVDPATNLVRIARKKGIPTINDYFTPKVAKKILKKYGKAKIVTCNNTFDHVFDLHVFMDGLRNLLAKDGIFMAEVPYFKTFIETHNHVVYHQQVDYLLLKPFSKLFEKYNMEIVDAEEIPYHGGSIRLFVGFKEMHQVSKRVTQLLKREEDLLKNAQKVLDGFGKSLLKQRDDLVKLLKKLKKDGKSIAAVGASAKGNVLLCYSKIGPQIIDFITEKSPLKVGRFTPSGIPVVADSELLNKQPDYAVLLAWNFKDEILNALRDYSKAGGKFIIPIPKPIII